MLVVESPIIRVLCDSRQCVCSTSEFASQVLGSSILYRGVVNHLSDYLSHAGSFSGYKCMWWIATYAEGGMALIREISTLAWIHDRSIDL